MSDQHKNPETLEALFNMLVDAQGYTQGKTAAAVLIEAKGDSPACIKFVTQAFNAAFVMSVSRGFDGFYVQEAAGNTKYLSTYQKAATYIGDTLARVKDSGFTPGQPYKAQEEPQVAAIPSLPKINP